jgi:hypothetical protein
LDAVVDALEDRPMVAEFEQDFPIHLRERRPGTFVLTAVELAVEFMLPTHLLEQLDQPGIDPLERPSCSHRLDCPTA